MEELEKISQQVYDLLRDFRGRHSSFIEVDTELRELGFGYMEIHELTNSIK